MTYKAQNDKPRSILLYAPVGELVIYGGIYEDKPPNMLGVKMAQEIKLPCDIDIPTKDFSIPKFDDLYIGVMKAILLLRKGKTVYVGCKGGVGRTGLFLCCLAKSAYGSDSGVVSYVRREYHPYAVETEEQRAMVAEFPSGKVRRWAFGGLWKLRLYIWWWERRKRLIK